MSKSDLTSALEALEAINADLKRWLAKRHPINETFYVGAPKPLPVRPSQDFEVVVYPIGTLTGEAKANADRLLRKSMQRTSE